VAVEPVVHSDGLVGALRAAVERGAPDGGVSAADELLRAFLGSRLGLHGRWYSPLPSGESARIDRELDAASAALDEARTAREEIAELSVERAALEDELAGARQELFVVVGMQRQDPQPRVQQPLDQQPIRPVDRDQAHLVTHQCAAQTAHPGLVVRERRGQDPLARLISDQHVVLLGRPIDARIGGTHQNFNSIQVRVFFTAPRPRRYRCGCL
jgi:hypothetical protein